MDGSGVLEVLVVVVVVVVVVIALQSPNSD